MPDFVHSLADNDVGKILVPLIIFVIWVVSAIASALYKQKPKKQRATEEQWQETLSRLPRDSQATADAIRHMLRGETGPQPPPLPGQRPPPSPQRQPQRRPQPPRTVPPVPRPRPVSSRRPAEPRAPRIASAPPSERPLASERGEQAALRLASVEASEIGKAPFSAKAAASSAAGSLRSMLRPGSLRRQIVVMEILSPPVAMRQQRL